MRDESMGQEGGRTADPREDLPIVVGVDGTAGSLAALRIGLREGAVRRVAVQVVTAWLPGPPMRNTPPERAYLAGAEAAVELQERAIAQVVAELGPGAVVPEVLRAVVQDVGGPSLVEASRRAQMLVVGNGRKGPLTRAFLGSVSEYCVRHAMVPVIVVPDPAKVDADARRLAAAARI